MKYRVRLEFNVKSTDLADVEVEADSREDAIAKAKQKHFDYDTDIDYYQSKHYESELADNESGWKVKEL